MQFPSVHINWKYNLASLKSKIGFDKNLWKLLFGLALFTYYLHFLLTQRKENKTKMYIWILVPLKKEENVYIC